MDRRSFIRVGTMAAGAALISKSAQAQDHASHGAASQSASKGPSPNLKGKVAPDTPAAKSPIVAPGGQVAVCTPNGSTLPWKVIDGVKVGHLIAQPIDHEFAPGMRAECWGYNGQSPGPTIEAIEGDRLRLYVSNLLNEPTTVHWHGLILPNGMDGVAGLTQKAIPPGQTFMYEFTLRYPGTFMYHPHYDEMTQIALGMAGMFIVHPKQPKGPKVDRDFVLMTHEWKLNVGAKRPDPNAMTDFNVLTFNSKAFPGTQPLLVGKGERVRIRLGNLSPMDHHPIHLHGLNFKMTATDGGYVPESAQHPDTTVLVPVGSTRVIEFVPEEVGDWAMHCHMTHHIMTQMGHGIPVMIGADTKKLDKRMQGVVPEYMTMGTEGMGGMGEMEMDIPPNSLPMKGAMGPFGYIDMGGMFTILKVRDKPEASQGKDTWFEHPQGSVSVRADEAKMKADGIVVPAKK